MAVYVVGDIQGCYKPLRRLLAKADFNPKKDQLWACGDLIGRGTQPLKTLDYLMSLGHSFQTVLGNHDLHFLAVTAGVRPAKKSDHFDQLLDSPYLSEYVQWLRQQPLALKPAKSTLLTHAGLYPGWSIKQALALCEEVSDWLQSDNYHSLLSGMYDPGPASWHEDLSGMERARFIINAMTRMRFVYPNGELDFKWTSQAEKAPAPLVPWFRHPSQQLKKHQTVLFGHWAALQTQTHHKQYVGLDTGCVWGGKLTMIKLGRMKYMSVKA